MVKKRLNHGSVLYLGIALECWDFAKLAIA